MSDVQTQVTSPENPSQPKMRKKYTKKTPVEVATSAQTAITVDAAQVIQMPPSEKLKEEKKADKFAAAKIFKRNDLGLVETVNYVFDENGSVDWKATIPKEFICANTEWFKKNKKEVPTSLEGLKDSQLLILLGGLKWAAKIRGFRELSFSPIPSNDGCTATCSITWAQNYESPSCKYTEIASCNPKNSNDFGLRFAEAVAANRAFSRCVRNYLNINIVSDEEIDKSEDSLQTSDSKAPSAPVSMKIDPVSILLKRAKESGLTDVKKIVDFIIASSTDLPTVQCLTFETEADFQKLDIKDAKILLSRLMSAKPTV